MLITPRSRLQLPRSNRGWTIARDIGARRLWDFRDGVGQTDAGGGLISAWIDQIGGTVTATASGSGRPTYVPGRGLLFNSDDFMEISGTGAMNIGSAPGSIVWYGMQLALDANPRNLISAGSSSQARVLRVNASTHRPGMTTVATNLEDTALRFSGLHVLMGEWADGRMELWFDGDYVGSAVATINTGNTRIRFGANASTTAGLFSIAYFNRVLFVNGRTSADEKRRIAAEVLGSRAVDVMRTGHPYRPRPPLPTFAENIAAINAAVAAAPTSTPDRESDLSPAPTVGGYEGAPNATDFPIGADVVNERQLLTIEQGWPMPDAGSYVSSKQGLLGYIDDENPTTLYANTTSFRPGCIMTSRYVAAHVYGVVDSRVRLIVRNLTAGETVAKYVAAAGQAVPGSTGSNTLTFDLGSVARREVQIDLPASNMMGGFYCESGGIVEPMDSSTPRGAWFGDSYFQAAGGQRYDAWEILAADHLNLPRGNFNGNTGSGFISDSGGDGVYTIAGRIPDITDSDLTLRQSLGITVRTDARHVVIGATINDTGLGFTRSTYKDAVLPILQAIRTRLPYAPIVCLGPWDIYYPSAVTSAWQACNDGLMDACAGIEHCAFLSLYQVEYDHLAPDNHHPSQTGGRMLAANLAPRLKAAWLAMA